jgi:hypothetical protein
MSLELWKQNGWLREYRTSQSEVDSILGLVDRDLADASREEVSADWRLKLPAGREALPSGRTCGECARYSSSKIQCRNGSRKTTRNCIHEPNCMIGLFGDACPACPVGLSDRTGVESEGYSTGASLQ